MSKNLVHLYARCKMETHTKDSLFRNVKEKGASLYFHPQPFVNVIKVDRKGIRVASEMFTEGQREEVLGFFVRDAS